MSKKSKDDFRNDFGSTDERRRESISDERSGTLSRRRFLGGVGAAAVAAAVGCKDRSDSELDVDGGPNGDDDGGVDGRPDGGPGSEPAKVTGLVQTGATSGSITMSWDPASGAEFYRVFVDGALTQDNVTGGGTTITGLSELTSYSVSVAGVNDVGEGEKSDPVTMSTNEADVEGDLSILKAFPTAEGSGAESVGGRGGQIVEVTNLNNSGPGSLREACSINGPTIIIFRVGGTISLETQIAINSNTTIAGQTAPGGGIQLRAHPENIESGRLFLIGSGDVIIQYLKIRPGAYTSNEPSSGVSGISISWTSDERVILDHCSFQWSFYGTPLSVWDGPSKISVQNCIVGWSRVNMLSGGNSESACFAVQDLDYHNNLIASSSHRNPMLKTNNIRFINNIVYNWTTGVSRISGGVIGDFINNYYKQGPSTISSNSSAGRDEITLVEDDKDNPEERERRITSRPPTAYVVGNRGTRSGMDPDADNWPYVKLGIGTDNTRELSSAPTSYQNTSPQDFPAHPVTVCRADEIEARIMDHVGASRRLSDDGYLIFNRDSTDQLFVEQYNLDTGALSSINNESEYGGFPSLDSGTPYPHAAGDGIADAWKTRNAARYQQVTGQTLTMSDNIGSSQVHAGFGINTGWTYLDLFLAGLDLPGVE